MKRLYAIILAAALVLCLSGCNMTILRRVYENKTGETLPVREGTLVTETTYYLYHTQTENADGSSSKTVYEYEDRKDPENPSRIIRVHTQCIFYENDKKIGTETYVRDEHGNPLSITPDLVGGEPQTFEYAYDEQGNILSEIAYLNGSKNYETIYTYNARGNLISKECHTDSAERFEYSYDNLNRITEESHYLDDVLLDRTVTEYADHGKRQKVIFYNGDGAITGYEEYTFDEKSSKETVREYDGNGILQRYLINSYGVHDQLIYQEVYSSDDELLSATNWYIVASKYSHMVYE